MMDAFENGYQKESYFTMFTERKERSGKRLARLRSNLYFLASLVIVALAGCSCSSCSCWCRDKTRHEMQQWSDSSVIGWTWIDFLGDGLAL